MCLSLASHLGVTGWNFEAEYNSQTLPKFVLIAEITTSRLPGGADVKMHILACEDITPSHFWDQFILHLWKAGWCYVQGPPIQRTVTKLQMMAKTSVHPLIYAAYKNIFVALIDKTKKQQRGTNIYCLQDKGENVSLCNINLSRGPLRGQ